MAQIVTLGAFLTVLMVCIVTGVPLLAGLCIGLGIFCIYALRCGHSLRAVGVMLRRGAAKSATILKVFVLIGLITAGWRVCGTIPFILYHAVRLIQPQVFALCAFLLCCGMSFLTGTAFGTATTMGFICAMLGRAVGLPVPLLGGMVLSGCYFGDRCSPMSSSALLVANITGTDIYRNIGIMLRSSLVPFLLSCLFYFLAGGNVQGGIDTSGVDVFAGSFQLSFWTVLPALIILVLAAFRLPVLLTMSVSAAAACLVALLVQATPAAELARVLVLGYHPENAQLAALLGGGGLRSMLNVSGIILVSSASFGIFDATGLLNGLKAPLQALAKHISPYGATILASLLLSGLACNQTLASMLAEQVCGPLFKTKEETMLALENTVIVMAPLIPWAIACMVPLAAVDAPLSSLGCAVYLYLLPLWSMAVSIWKQKRGARTRC